MVTGCARSRPLLVGYYGEHNLGDDALLQVLLAQLPGHCRATVTARDQAEVRQRYGVATVDRRRLGAVLVALNHGDALVFGGGSLLQDATSFASLLYYAALVAAARLRGRSVLLWAQGLGPLRRRRSRLLVRALLRLVNGCSWRDAQSAALARELGWRPDRRQLACAAAASSASSHDIAGQAGVGSDPVWSLEAPAWSGEALRQRRRGSAPQRGVLLAREAARGPTRGRAHAAQPSADGSAIRS